jgi:hypothetical protein
MPNREALLKAGWQPVLDEDGEWWLYGGVGQGYRIATAFKHAVKLGMIPKILNRVPQDFEQGEKEKR